MSTTRPDFTTSTFWLNTLERVVRTAAQAAVAAFAADHTIADIDFGEGAGLAGFAALMCLLMALAGKAVGDGDTPSYILPAPREVAPTHNLPRNPDSLF